MRVRNSQCSGAQALHVRSGGRSAARRVWRRGQLPPLPLQLRDGKIPFVMMQKRST